jgi:predicted nucleic acid-binding protein
VSALILDAGAFIAVERNDRNVIATLRVAQQAGLDLRTHALVIAQVWRSGGARQARIARLLPAIDVQAVDENMGREAGELLGRARTQDAIDATVVVVARSGDRILTSDPKDIRHLVSHSGKQLVVVQV